MAKGTTAALHPPGAVYEQAAAFQGNLNAGLSAANDQMLASWAQVYGQIRAEYNDLLLKIAAAQANGTPVSPAWLYQKDRLKNALATTKAQVHTFAQQASAATVQAHDAAVKASAKAHAQMGAQAMQEAGLAGGFTRLNEDNLKHLAGFLADGTPVDALFTSLATETAEAARNVMVKGLTLGKGVDWMARRLDQALDIPRWRAETIIRTEGQRVYRSVARQTYMANADVLEGWVWTAHLDSRTCSQCVVMDGTVMPVGSTLDGHPRCRCAMVPRTKSWADLGDDTAEDTRPPIRSGKDWLKAQGPSVQRAVLGPRRYAAWKDGKITLDDLVARTQSPVWGTMRRERSLLEIAEGRNANWDDVVEIVAPPPPALTPDVAAVQSIAATHTLDEVEATLQHMTLTEQGRLNFLAAHQMKVAELPKGPSFRLPEPDPVWANKATEKMNAAVLSKGYPSKGYSQTVAIYKAKANGTPGTKVGVVKSLTWQEKINAQKALADHDAWLQQHLAKSLAAKGEGKGIVKALDDDWDTALDHSGMVFDYEDAKNAATFMQDAAQQARTQALLDAKWAAYMDEVEASKGFADQSAEWVNAKGDTLVIDKNTGWAVHTVETPSGTTVKVVKPGDAVDMVASDDWDVPVIEPDPEQVGLIVNVLKDKDGYYDEAVGNVMETQTLHMPGIAPQHATDLAEALNVAKATLPWKPEPAYVAKILDGLKASAAPDLDVADLLKIANTPGTKPLSKANILKAVEDWKAEVQAASKPVAVTPNPTAVNTVLKKLDKGEVTPAQVKAKADGLTTKSPQIQANNAKALADWEAKGGTGPGVPVQQAPAKVGFGSPPNVDDLHYTGQTLGTHGAKVYTDPQGNRWLFKPPKDSGDAFLTTLDEAASRLQAQTGLKAPDTFVVTLGGKRGSLQRMFDAKDAFPSGLKPSTLSGDDLLAVQKEHVLDWLLSNHDGHHQQFLRLPDGTLTGIDKGQAFRWVGQDRLDWDFHPNASYGSPEPVYNTLWRDFAQGGSKDVLDPSVGPLADYIKSVQSISDDDLRAMFRPYAEQAAARGRLAVRQTYPGLKAASSIPANDVEAFLDAIVARKHALAKDFDALYAKAVKARQKALPDWKPTKATPPKGTTGKAKWKGAPQPEQPKAPPEPDAVAAPQFDPWLSKVKAKYEAFAPGKKLEASNNWARVRRVIDDRDRKAVQELLDRHYLDDDLAQEALRLIDKADAEVAAAKAVHDKAVQAYQKALKAWQRDVRDWRDANGIKDVLKGLDAGKRHTDTGGNTWGRKHWKPMDEWSLSERKHLGTYSGSDYTSINGTGRGLGAERAANPDNWGSWSSLVRGIDNAMDKATRFPEDTVIVRGTGVDSFTVDGRLLTGTSAHRMSEIVGTVQRDEGYMSTSLGATPGFGSGKKVQMKILAPAGSRGAYIDPISKNQGERELLLPRGTNLYIHAAYEQNGRWIVEAEIVPDGFVPPTGPNGEPILSPATKKWDWP